MNPHAEALKKRTFDFALRIVYFCRDCGRRGKVENSPIRSFEPVRASGRIAAPPAAAGLMTSSSRSLDPWWKIIAAGKTSDDPDLPGLIVEAGELLAIFNQSQLTARTNQAARRAAEKQNPKSRNPPSKSPIRKLANSSITLSTA